MAFRTDLAVEAIENHKTAAALPHVRQSDRTLEGFAVHEVRILSEDAAREIGKPQGRYLTLELDALIRREEDAFPRACKALSTLLRELLPHPNDGPVLIAGLGNPEPKYDGTRHNAGFEALDYLAAQWHCDIAKAKWQGLYGTAQVGEHKVVLLKPLTYMNLSGQSIAPAANFYKIPADHVIVLCDDITQEPGHLRIRPHGSAGGHNGLKSIIASLGTENFARIRIGIGAKPNPQYDLAAWVLGKLPPADRKAMTDRYPDIEDACRLLMDGNLQYAQNKFNH